MHSQDQTCPHIKFLLWGANGSTWSLMWKVYFHWEVVLQAEIVFIIFSLTETPTRFCSYSANNHPPTPPPPHSGPSYNNFQISPRTLCTISTDCFAETPVTVSFDHILCPTSKGENHLKFPTQEMILNRLTWPHDIRGQFYGKLLSNRGFLVGHVVLPELSRRSRQSCTAKSPLHMNPRW